ncbi:MAG: QacE family quaternary ammonium compound efflux SMR transporter [Candidatus Methanomethylophilaceae archaeon]|jgi:quaternary ammonium compound-resistance protein SugE|nr:QacE family quaternary ammonium compound efflux SMR transporter [Candidatus Methanomethylophilaceae archaeon]MBR7006975.1 QacE family quaternary ammonium compound efflux SMR transporter [Candidatus Methanomethylophilaceae archaeon]
MEIKNKTAFAWILIILGGFLQLGWSIGLAYTESFTNIGWDIVTIVFLFLSMVCLEYPMRLGVPFTTAYAVWIGIGVFFTVVLSYILGLEETAFSPLMGVCLALILAGVVGLKLTPVEYIDEKKD